MRLAQSQRASLRPAVIRQSGKGGEWWADGGVLGLQIEVGRDRIAQWPGPRQLTVLAEQATMFYDVMTEGIVNQARGRAGEVCTAAWQS